MRPIEATVDYAIAIKDQTIEGLGFTLTGILIISTPLILVLLTGIVMYISVIAIGYFVALSLISPSTAEQIVKNRIAPKIQDQDILDEEIEEE